MMRVSTGPDTGSGIGSVSVSLPLHDRAAWTFVFIAVP